MCLSGTSAPCNSLWSRSIVQHRMSKLDPVSGLLTRAWRSASIEYNCGKLDRSKPGGSCKTYGNSHTRLRNSPRWLGLSAVVFLPCLSA